MTPAQKLLALIVALPLANASLHAQATIIYNDTFDVGATPTLGDDLDAPTDATWLVNNAGGFTTTAGPDTGGALAATGNSVDLSLTGSGTTVFREFYTRFAETTLAVGETLSASFTFRLYDTPTLPNKTDQLRIILSNSTKAYTSSNSGSGYSFEIGTGSGNGGNNQFKFRATSSVGSGGTTVTGFPAHGLVLVNDTASHTATFSVTRTSETQNTLSFQLDGGTPITLTTTLGITPATNGATLTAFDHFGILAAAGPFRYRLDNLQLVKITPAPADTDNDFLDDTWETLNFGNLDQTGSGDPDGDTFNNEAEETAGSNPNNILSVPGDNDGDGLDDAWENTHFGNLSQIGSGDQDGDLATNEQEETAGTDPSGTDGFDSFPDGDGDGLADAWEIFHFGAVDDPRATFEGDPDSDSFTNNEERFYRTNPLDVFSSPDLDLDGLPDGWEIFYFTGTANDATSDTDADGFNNSFEFGLRTNPNLATSVPGDLDNNGTNDGPVLKPSGDAVNTTSFSDGLNWHNGLAPVAGQTYIVDGTSANGGGLRTSTTNADYTFAGDRIVFTKGGILVAKHAGAITFTLAEFNGGTINQATNTSVGLITLNGAIQITGTTASNFWANNGPLTVNATVSGPADLNLTGNQLVTFNGTLTGTGDLIVAAHATAPTTNRLNLSATSSLTFTLGDAAATNTISGTGAVSLNGAFVIDTAAVTDTTVGNSWALVSTTGAKTYGSTFSVLGYTSDGAAPGTRKWTAAAAPFFQFDEATGSLGIVTNPDSDSDGLPDSWEITHFTNLDQNGAGDFDNDLVTNAAELAAGTNPADNTSWPDTDADGVNDAFEIATFGDLTTATITDRDGDTLLDAWEIVYFGNTTAATAASGDNDADGATNAQEFTAGSDPDDAASKPVDTDGDGILDVNEAVKPYTVDADTLHLWHLDETSAPFANAVNTAHNLQGMFNGAIAWTPSLGGFGTSVNTNSGTTPNFGIVTYAPTLDGAITGDTATPADPAFVWQGADGAFTFEAIVRFDSLPTTWTSPISGHIITMEGDGALTEDRVFQFRIDTNNPTAPALQFQRLNGATESVATALPLTGDHAIDTTSWFHVAVTYDGSEGVAGNTKLYWTRIAPGVAAANLLGEGILTSDFPAGIQGDLSIGNEARGTPGEPFRGSIDEVRISRIARADTGFLFAAALSPYQSWAVANSLTLGVNDGATQDPDNDGLANLLEYATGAANNPLAPTANPVTTQVITNVSSNKVLRLDFPRVNDPSLSYVVQATSDLATAFTDVITYPAGTTPVQHEDTVALTAGVRRFLRLEIRQN